MPFRSRKSRKPATGFGSFPFGLFGRVPRREIAFALPPLIPCASVVATADSRKASVGNLAWTPPPFSNAGMRTRKRAFFYDKARQK
jgi:hypothetical protein